tara:strand:- start:103 stop:1119 length:1017 start_codon:yes stop_codon:yes gene_type:complete
MKNRLLILSFFVLTLFIGIIVGLLLRHNENTWLFIKKPFIKHYKNKSKNWSQDFSIDTVRSTIDSHIQKIYYYKSKSKTPKPLIVSLHTWGGDYSQNDDLANLCKQRDLNYIHPDFRGPNSTNDACCSDLALNDIDEAITFAISNFNIDKAEIYVIGISGGGYATLSAFMKSQHNIKKFSAWASITDLIARYHESKTQNSRVSNDILNCTNSSSQLNIENAKQKSPLYLDTPIEKLKESKVSIYAGVFDGIQKHVPITHSINFYNKILGDLSVSDSTKYVSIYEKLKLIEFRKPLGDYGYIGDRKVYLRKEFENLKLVIFEGDHEMLTEFALNELIDE